MNRLLSSAVNLVLALVLGAGLSGCVSTRVPIASTSPWQAIDLETQSNPLDAVSYTHLTLPTKA